MWLFWPDLKDAFPQACFQSEVQTPSCVFQAQQNWSQPQVSQLLLLLSLLHPALAYWTPSCPSKTPGPCHHTASPPPPKVPLCIHTLLPSGLCSERSLKLEVYTAHPGFLLAVDPLRGLIICCLLSDFFPQRKTTKQGCSGVSIFCELGARPGP